MTGVSENAKKQRVFVVFVVFVVSLWFELRFPCLSISRKGC